MQTSALILDHLWQSTLFVLFIGLLVSVLRKNRARVRYWLWFGASLKFLIPFSLIAWIGGAMGLGGAIDLGGVGSERFVGVDRWLEASLQPVSALTAAELAAPLDVPPPTAETVAVAEDVVPQAASADLEPRGATLPLALWLGIAVWLCGTAVVVAAWLVRWLAIRRLVATAAPLPDALSNSFPVPVLESDTTIEPGIVGVTRPVLLLPKGIRDRLTPRQFRAVLAHERVHLERRDNLTASLHMIVEAVFWFHPLIWWIGARLITERERACDEAAVKRVDSREGYADGILGVCKFYVAPPLRSTAAVSGGDLRKRIEAILLGSDPEELSMLKKTLLTAFLMAVFVGPVLLGAFEPLEAQTIGATGASASEWRNSPYVRSLYEQARAEGAVRILGFDRRGLNWMQQAIAEEFPGITVMVAPVLSHMDLVQSQLQEGRPLQYDLAQTSLMEAQVFNEHGLLTPMDWSAFGVPTDRVVPGGWFAYTNNFVFTIAYDRTRVGQTIGVGPRGELISRPIPSTWRELLQSEYTGLLASNPWMLRRLVAGLGVAWGPYEAESYARGLLSNQQMLVQGGDAALIMLDDDMSYPYYVGMAHTATELWVRAGLPTRYVVPEPVIMEQQGPAVFATAPHPAAARLIAGYLASPEGIAARQKYSYSVDLRPESRDPMAVALREQARDIVYDSPATARERARMFGTTPSILQGR